MIISGALKHLKKVLFLVGSERRKLVMLLPLYLVLSATDLVGIGMLVSLISAVKNPEMVRSIMVEIPGLADIANSQSVDRLTTILALLVFGFYAIKTCCAFYVTRKTLKITFTYGAKLRSYLMWIYQRQSYERFIQHNSADYIYNIQTMAGQFITYTIQPILKILGDGMVALFIIAYLAIKAPFIMVLLLTMMGLVAVLYDKAHRIKVAAYGSKDISVSSNLIKSISEGLAAYRESHIYGVTGFFHRAVSKAASALADLRIRSQMITNSSRFLLEFVVVLCVVAVIIITVYLDRNKDELLTILALFIVASMRLIPATNQIVMSVGKIRYGGRAVDVLYRDISSEGVTKIDFENQDRFSSEEVEAAADQPPFDSLMFKDVCFKYEPDGPWVLDSVNLRIEKHDIVGVIGPSGAGKTTMIALILGLLKPQSGTVSCDGMDIKDSANVKAWHKKVAYLPQETFMVDGTIASNVALGIDDEHIDKDKLDYALKKAQLSEMVKKLPEGVNSMVGEKGMWVSGGQRQRIALARAFYYDSEVLILDESTNALDTETAKEIIGELRQLKGNVTIIVITHQEMLLELCNKVFRIEDSKLVQQ